MPDSQKPKYPTEFALEFQSVDRFLFRIADLDALDDHARDEILSRLDQCHVYIVAKRPRLSAVPGTLSVSDREVRMGVEYRLGGAVGRASFAVPRSSFDEHEVSFAISDYPHRELISRNAHGETVVETLLANFAHLMADVPDAAKDLEVLYIGKGLSPSARDRLASHSTLQKILADVHSNEPDYEVFALTYAFTSRKPALVYAGRAEIEGAAAKARRLSVMAYRPSLEEQISLIEASCISYFRPAKYNTHYLDFPARHYRMLRPVYEADFAQIIVQLDNTNIGGQRLYSAAAKPSGVHYVVVDFRRLEGKYSPFANVQLN